MKSHRGLYFLTRRNKYTQEPDDIPLVIIES